ncbi:testis-expressed protein 47 isoform X2 [Betta splendens]|uniref:Testis-expressed protein 47 isoform X2 n=1 Tax=Betta splendens TaxID=158456 RepID=A0A6P7L3B8_BETSP|nr:testis-expressed protein 47 isoform X2 [Betta splendens]
MASTQKLRNFKTREFRDTGLEERDQKTMFEFGFYGNMREKIVLQQLIVIARLPYGADGTELGAHYEKLNFQLSKQYIWDNITGLLLLYPTCLLHIIESSRDILVSVLKDLRDLQQQTDNALLKAPKVVFMAHDSQSRLFHQWSYKMLEAAQMQHRPKRLQEEEESTATMVCTVLSALQSLSKHPDISRKALPGSVLDKNPELSVPQEILEALLNRDELQNPQQYLQLYNSPLNVSMDFGCATTDESWDVLGASSPGGWNH